MHYIHGTTAEKMAEIKQCEAGMYGDVTQDHHFRHKLAEIQARISSCKCSVVSSPACLGGKENPSLTIGPDVYTGSGPWNSSENYYRHLTEALIEEAVNKGYSDNGGSPSYELPALLFNLVKTHSMREFAETGFPSSHRDLGAHNILVNDQFKIVGIVGLKDVAAVPPEMVAQYPPLSCMEIDLPGVARNLLGVVEEDPHALDQVRKQCLNDKHRQHQQWFMDVEAFFNEPNHPIGRRFGSVAALVAQAMLRCSELDEGEKAVWVLAGQKLLTCPGPSF